MSRKSLKIQVEVSGWTSIDSNSLLAEIKKNVFSQLKEQNCTVSEGVVIKSIKNALSLARSKKKNISKLLFVYIPQNYIDRNNTCDSNLVSSTSVENEENSKDVSGFSRNHDTQAYPQLIFHFENEKGLTIDVTFVYLRQIFSCLLSRSSISADLSHFLNEICAHCFDSAAKFYINVLQSRRELRLQLKSFIRNAKKKAKALNTSAINVLAISNNFVFYLKSVESVHRTDEFLSIKFHSFASNSSSDRILLIRDKDQLFLEPVNKSLYMYISESFAIRALEQFELANILNVDEICFIVQRYCQRRQLVSNIEKNMDNLKICILNRKTDINQPKFFPFMIELTDRNLLPENYDAIDLDTLLGSVYSTREIKRGSREVTLDTDYSDFEANNNEQDELWQLKPSSSTGKKSKGK